MLTRPSNIVRFAPDLQGALVIAGEFIVADNWTITAVPVPAAVWLFGSALAGLGWMRRKQTI